MGDYEEAEDMRTEEQKLTGLLQAKDEMLTEKNEKIGRLNKELDAAAGHYNALYARAEAYEKLLIKLFRGELYEA